MRSASHLFDSYSYESFCTWSIVGWRTIDGNPRLLDRSCRQNLETTRGKRGCTSIAKSLNPSLSQFCWRSNRGTIEVVSSRKNHVENIVAFEIKGRRLEVPLEDVFTLQFMGKLCPCGTPRTRDLKMAHRVGRSRSPISELTNKRLLLVNSVP